MDDKGREAIVKYVGHIYGLGTQDDSLLTLKQAQGMYERLADDIIQELRSNGWHHKDDEAEGWAVMETSIKFSKEPAKLETTERTATLQEVLDGKAVKS